MKSVSACDRCDGWKEAFNLPKTPGRIWVVTNWAFEDDQLILQRTWAQEGLPEAVWITFPVCSAEVPAGVNLADLKAKQRKSGHKIREACCLEVLQRVVRFSLPSLIVVVGKTVAKKLVFEGKGGPALPMRDLCGKILEITPGRPFAGKVAIIRSPSEGGWEDGEDPLDGVQVDLQRLGKELK